MTEAEVSQYGAEVNLTLDIIVPFRGIRDFDPNFQYRSKTTGASDRFRSKKVAHPIGLVVGTPPITPTLPMKLAEAQS